MKQLRPRSCACVGIRLLGRPVKQVSGVGLLGSPSKPWIRHSTHVQKIGPRLLAARVYGKSAAVSPYTLTLKGRSPSVSCHLAMSGCTRSMTHGLSSHSSGQGFDGG